MGNCVQTPIEPSQIETNSQRSFVSHLAPQLQKRMVIPRLTKRTYIKSPSMSYLLRRTLAKQNREVLEVREDRIIIYNTNNNVPINDVYLRIFKQIKIHGWNVESFKIRPQTERVFGKIFQNNVAKMLPKLKKIDLDLKELEHLDSVIPQVLGPLTNLQAFTLKIQSPNFYGTTNKINIGPKIFKNQISKGLKHFGFNCVSCPEIDDKSVKSLASIISDNRTSLLSLQIGFDLCPKLTNKTPELLRAQIIPLLNKLKRLSLRFSSCNLMTEQGLKMPELKSQHNLSNLQGLCLNFSNMQIADMDILNSYMSQFNSLKLLELSFNACKNIGDHHLTSLVTSLRSRKVKLQHLELSFVYCTGLTNMGVQAFIKSSPELFKNLESISLDFSWCDITDKTLQKLTDCLSENFINLKELNLIFKGCTKITDACFGALASRALEELSNLKLLKLDFRGCELRSKFNLNDKDLRMKPLPAFNIMY